MKFIHLADLHLGKRVNQFSMVDDQRHILAQILDLIAAQTPDGVLIAGDVYDRTVPSTEAVTLLDDFLVGLSQLHIPTFLISGNHDSPQRLAFGNRILEAGQIHIAPVYQGHVSPITLTDAQGAVDVYLLPFVKPVHVRSFFPDDELETYTQAVSRAIAEMEIDTTRRNVLLTHQFVTGSTRCDSEDVSVGGSDNVDAVVFAPFDYVALGHLHGAQNVGDSRVRYCGTPLKYSFSEVHHEKSITVVELTDTLTVTTLPLIPLRDMVEVRGTYLEVTAKSFYEGFDQNAYLRVTLTDEEDVPGAVERLRVIYPNLMRLDYDNKRTRSGNEMPQAAVDAQTLQPQTLFESLYHQQNGGDFSPQQSDYLETLIASIWEGEV